MVTSLYKLVLSCSKVVQGGYKFVQACITWLLQLCLQFKFLGYVTVVNIIWTIS